MSTRKPRFNYEAPDGLNITPNDYPSKEKADAALAAWLKRYERQGYYSTVEGERIPMAELPGRCLLIQS